MYQNTHLVQHCKNDVFSNQRNKGGGGNVLKSKGRWALSSHTHTYTHTHNFLQLQGIQPDPSVCCIPVQHTAYNSIKCSKVLQSVLTQSSVFIYFLCHRMSFHQQLMPECLRKQTPCTTQTQEMLCVCYLSFSPTKFTTISFATL